MILTPYRGSHDLVPDPDPNPDPDSDLDLDPNPGPDLDPDPRPRQPPYLHLPFSMISLLQLY